MRSRTISSMVLLALAGSALSWWQQGHLLVARVAYGVLEKEAPQALSQIQGIIREFKNKETHFEGDYPFVECATFADAIKADGGSWQSNWHFIDLPYLDKGGSVKDYPKFQEETQHIAVVVPAIIDWLNGAAGYQNSFVYQTIMQHVQTEELGKSYAVRLLIHYLGDLHQPLHCASKLDPQYPAGDRGGNSIPIPYKEQAKNLHSVWDSVVYEHNETPALPYTSQGWSDVSNLAAALQAKYSISSSDYENLNVEQWAEQSFTIASQNVYKDVVENQALSQAYINSNTQIAERQIVLGGMRLAHIMKTIYGSSRFEN